MKNVLVRKNILLEKRKVLQASYKLRRQVLQRLFEQVLLLRSYARE